MDPRTFLAGGLLGPTAAGKTEVALHLAQRHGLEILTVDSRQVYRGLERGTAKPSPNERSRVRHHLLDVLDPREACSAGRFRDLALAVLAEAGTSGRRLLGVGGAGLYWEALLRGLHDLPRASKEIRAQHAHLVAEKGPRALHEQLALVDPESAARLAPGDTHRVSRALEVAAITGKPLSAHLRAPRPASFVVPAVLIERERSDLYHRIEVRCRRMLEEGLVEELRRLLESGVPSDAPGLRTLGYREFLPHVRDGAPLAPCVEEFIRASRRYAKRQGTWFRNRLPEAVILQVAPDSGAEETARRAAAALKL